MKLINYSKRTQKRLLSAHPHLVTEIAFNGELRVYDKSEDVGLLVSFVRDHNNHRNRALYLQIAYVPFRDYLTIVFQVSKPKNAIYVSL